MDFVALGLWKNQGILKSEFCQLHHCLSIVFQEPSQIFPFLLTDSERNLAELTIVHPDMLLNQEVIEKRHKKAMATREERKKKKEDELYSKKDVSVLV